MSDRFSATRRLESFRYAGRGIVWMLRTQHNTWIHASVSLAVLVVGFWSGLDAGEWCWIALAMMAVWTAEAMNSAIEQLANVVSPAPDANVGRAKDVAAGAVLISAIGAAAIGLLVLGPRLLERI